MCCGNLLVPLCGLGPECFKTVFRELPGSTLRAGPRVLQNCSLGATWLRFASWLQNSSKLCSGCCWDMLRSEDVVGTCFGEWLSADVVGNFQTKSSASNLVGKGQGRKWKDWEVRNLVSWGVDPPPPPHCHGRPVQCEPFCPEKQVLKFTFFRNLF